ncbi:WbqC family protein [Sphingobacterium bovistauri]|uniref:WbqC family protein n=1 Tax=Sphingobacterium bovistauri TaxID=2781959 RepID=A0ABS7Z069_9SPHI|nr:WbqC family protein [Sphingobacterium bovistauri]MCA5003563.1 WbqC family protein [Sphingobacterium bovistauri]
MSNSIILSAIYLPPVSYFHAIAQNEGEIKIDKYENFQKQTYRNRTKIATANGILELFIPIQHGRKERVAMQGVKISYDHDWQRLHWSSIQTAYRSSPYFEYYEDDFKALYEQKYEFLFDFNIAQLELILKCLKLKRTISFTDSFEKSYDVPDFRNSIHPKKESAFMNPKPYYQIFEDRNGFIPDVSVIDLIFNQGPQSKNYL